VFDAFVRTRWRLVPCVIWLFNWGQRRWILLDNVA
jgi:hypothetical protein